MNKQIPKKEIQKYSINSPAKMVYMAKTLKKHIIDNNLYVEIVGKNYVMVEGWQFAGGLLGLLPRIAKVKCLGDNKWFAHAEIINQKTKEVISSGFAICSKEENKKKSFDEYAILSMAQTRAIGKAYRNLIGWVIKLAGYESIPAEEVTPIKESNAEKFEKAKKMIGQIKNPDGLIEYSENLKKSTFNAEQKKELQKLVSLRVDALNN